MKTKHILTAMVLPALFAACTQEEVALENNAKMDLSSRPVLANVTLSIDEASTRMSVADGTDYAIKPDAGDGLGACIIDIPTYTDANYATLLEAADGDATELYTIKEYISSNYRYDYDETTGKWNTQALLSEGNYVFYAPHSESHLLRMPLSAVVPVEQSVTKEEPNKAIKDFYANASTEGYPVLIDYKFLSAKDQDKNVAVTYRHIMSYPKFTLKNSYKEGDAAKAVKVTKVVFAKKDGSEFIVKAPLLNGEAPESGIAKKALGGENPLWINREIEEAATSNVLNESSTNVEKSETITVNFGTGIEIAADGTFSFYAVIPAEAYIQTAHLTATVYTADNKQFKTAFELDDITMNPGKRYPAQEYNTRMSADEKTELKETAGTLATIVMEGEQVEVQAKATGLKNNAELIEYLAKVATRYRDLKQVNAAFVASNIYDATETGYVKYDSGLHFTLADDAKIVINDELIDALVKYIYKDVTGGSIKFLAEDVEAGKIVLGSTTKLDEYDIEYNGAMNATPANFTSEGLKDKTFIKFATDANPKAISLSAGTTTLKEAIDGITDITVPAGAILNLDKDLDAASLNVVNNGGTINVAENVKVASIANNKGTLNLNADVAVADIATITNGALELKEGSTDVQEYKDEKLETKNESTSNVTNYVKVISNGTINIATDMAVASTITNHPGSTINNNGYMNGTSNSNGGTIVLGSKADLNVAAYTYTNYEGVIENNELVTLTGTIAGQDVVCSLTALPKKAVKSAKINHVVFTANVELAEDVFASSKILEEVTRVDLKCQQISTPVALTNATSVDFYIYNDITWVGDKMTPVEMESGVINKLYLLKNKKLTKTGVTLPEPEEF